MKSAQWVVGLSNGVIAVEGVGMFSEIAGEPSPWLKLQEYISQNSLTITSISIQKGGQLYNMPSNNPRFGGEIPVSYNYFRKVITDIFGNINSLQQTIVQYIVIEARYIDFTIQLWVTENGEHDRSWVNLVKTSNSIDI